MAGDGATAAATVDDCFLYSIFPATKLTHKPVAKPIAMNLNFREERNAITPNYLPMLEKSQNKTRLKLRRPGYGHFIQSRLPKLIITHQRFEFERT